MITKLVRRLFWVSLAAILVIFSVYNRQVINVNIPFTEHIVPLGAYWLLFIGIFLGVGLAGVITSWFRLKGFVATRKAERRSSELEVQVDALAEDAQKERSRQAQARLQSDL